ITQGYPLKLFLAFIIVTILLEIKKNEKCSLIFLFFDQFKKYIIFSKKKRPGINLTVKIKIELALFYNA
ncbi:hypothetical protein UP02_22470, partial [Enterobacter hormaechei]